jgi:trk system potassium uptake protein TrkH
MYINISNGNPVKIFTDSVFESASGYTTTGFSVISNLSTTPKSIIVYRSLTQFIGGLGIVLVLLAFFYPETKLQEFSRGMGFTKNHKIKRTFFMILLIYMVFFVAMMIIGLLSGYRDVINLFSFIFSALSTGGFSPIVDITNVATQSPLGLILIVSMVLGASNFLILAGLFKLRFKEFLKSEVTVFLFMAFISISIVTIFFSYSLFDSTFHVISAMSTTGFSYLKVYDFSGNLKLFLVFLMFVGGASFSTAGGIKIYRFLLLFKVTKKVVTDSITQRDTTVKLFGKEYTNAELIQVVTMVILMAGIILISAAIVSSYGNSPIDSIFEVTSAIATTGLSVGIAGPSLAMELKWLFVLLMILGRIEILAFLIAFSRAKEPKEVWSAN